MKKGHVGIIVGILVIVFLLGIIAWAFRPAATGQVKGEDVVATTFISEPFELRAWVVDAEGVRLDISNPNDRDYLVRSVEIGGCGISDYGREITRGESSLFTIKCNLNKGERFSGIIIVNYISDESGAEVSAFGNIEDIV